MMLNVVDLFDYTKGRLVMIGYRFKLTKLSFNINFNFYFGIWIESFVGFNCFYSTLLSRLLQF